jgi:hypothetical protein
MDRAGGYQLRKVHHLLEADQFARQIASPVSKSVMCQKGSTTATHHPVLTSFETALNVRIGSKAEKLAMEHMFSAVRDSGHGQPCL